jgi:hypothetical protein
VDCGCFIRRSISSIEYQCEEFTKILTYYQLVVIFELVVSCVLPLCVIAFSYVMTACSLVENSRSISQRTQNPQLQTRRNTAKIVMGLAFVFMISYVPYHVFWAYFIYSQKVDWVYKVTQDDVFSSYQYQFTYLISI